MTDHDDGRERKSEYTEAYAILGIHYNRGVLEYHLYPQRFDTKEKASDWVMQWMSMDSEALETCYDLNPKDIHCLHDATNSFKIVHVTQSGRVMELGYE